MPAFGGKADMGWKRFDVRFRPKADMGRQDCRYEELIPEPHSAGCKSLM
jgi:hypothetical protein